MRSCANKKTAVINEMRELWSQHVYWTRFFIISTISELDDLKCVTNRLMENPGDFACTLRNFYGAANAEKFKALLTEHLKIGGELVNAAKDGDTGRADMLRKEWYRNADEIAVFLCRISPFWSEKEWQEMLYSHLELTEKEVGFRLKKEYQQDIRNFGVIENEAMKMADYMSSGIIRQFLCG